MNKIYAFLLYLCGFVTLANAQPICTPNLTPDQAFLAIKNANNPRQSSPISVANAPIQPNTPIQTIKTTTPIPTSNLININTATEAELSQLNGIGNKKAQAIIQYRETVAPFRTVDDLANVKGIGIKTVEKNRAMITVQ